jgi:hypothetical protein
MRYWAGLDRKDAGLFAAAFTSDAVLSVLGGERVLKVSDMISGGNFHGGYKHTSHAVASQVIDVIGDTATADTFVIAHLVPTTGPILVRGLRYHDQLIREQSEWRIKRRDHEALWQYDVEPVAPYLQAATS